MQQVDIVIGVLIMLGVGAAYVGAQTQAMQVECTVVDGAIYRMQGQSLERVVVDDETSQTVLAECDRVFDTRVTLSR